MPTLEQITQLQDAAQNILDLQPFDEIQPTIEAAAQGAPDKWWEARICKMPVGAAIGHLIGTRAITKVQTGTAPEAPASLPPYERYLAMTEVLDCAAAHEVMAEQQHWPPTLQAASDYFIRQFDFIIAFEEANHGLITRRGKLPAPYLSAQDAWTEQVTDNARGNTMAHIVREALRICMRERAVPEPIALSQELTTTLQHHGQHVTLPGELFHNLLFGRSLARERHRNLKERGELTTPKWNQILRQYVEQRTLHPHAYDMAHLLRQPLDNEVHKITGGKVIGLCNAQFWLRPYEYPNEPLTQAQHATDFFAAYGIPLNEGAFRLVDYQLLRGISAAETTIFADPEYRAGFLAIVHAVQGE